MCESRMAIATVHSKTSLWTAAAIVSLSIRSKPSQTVHARRWCVEPQVAHRSRITARASESRHVKIALRLQGLLARLEQSAGLLVGEEQSDLSITEPCFERSDQLLVDTVAHGHLDALTGGFEAIGIVSQAAEMVLSHAMQLVARCLRCAPWREVFLQAVLELRPSGDCRSERR